MPVPSETEPGREGLPVIGLAAARELFRTAESGGLGRPGTDEIFDRWLDNHCDIAFHHNADRPLQARAIAMGGEVPEWLSGSRVGRARLEAVCLNSYQYLPSPSPEPACADMEDEEFEETDEDEDTDDHSCFSGMPGLCWDSEIRKKRYAKVDSHQDHEDCDEEGCVLVLVNAYPGGMARDPHWDLSDELRPDFHGRSLRGLTVLIEAAQRKLDTERWDTDGPWRLWWTSCESDVTNPLDRTEGIAPSGDDAEGGSGKIRSYVSVRNGVDTHTVEAVRTRGGHKHVMYHAPVPEAEGEAEDTETPEGLRRLLERATELVREAGYEIHGDWTVDWTRCRVLLAD